MKKGEKLADGRTAEIFAWGDNQVIKLLRPGFPLAMLQHELACAREVHETGIPTPAPGQLTTADGRPGLIFQKVAGQTMLQTFFAGAVSPAKLARQLAELQADMHGRTALGLPSLLPRLRRSVTAANPLPKSWKQAVLSTLDTLPAGTAVLHGDFHPDNIILTPNGPVIIDMVDATQGHPLADVARTLLLLTPHRPPETAPDEWRSLNRTLALIRAAYVRRYRELRPFADAELAQWFLPIAAARLAEGIPEQEAGLLGVVKLELSKFAISR